MKSYVKKSNAQDQNKTPANAVNQKKGSERHNLEFADNRDVSVTQTGLQLMINNSPRMVAQRKQLESSFGIPVQRQGSQEQGKLEPVQKKENKTGLPDKLKTGIENLSGISMDDVKVHYNSPKPAQLQALAYTQGTEIHVGPGQEKHLPHEAWHVVQQSQGRVQPTLQMQGVAINDDQALENEADFSSSLAIRTPL